MARCGGERSAILPVERRLARHAVPCLTASSPRGSQHSSSCTGPAKCGEHRLLEIREDKPADELDLIPEYYREDVGRHHLWLKLTEFRQLDPGFAESDLVLADADDPSLANAMKGQASLLYVREKHPEPSGLQVPADRQIWWVNQGTNYRDERDGGFVVGAPEGRKRAGS